MAIDSVINTGREITLVYSISDSLAGYRFQVDAYALVGNDTLSLASAGGYPQDSLEAGTYRLRWDPVAALERYRGEVSFLVFATPGFKLVKGPEPSYKPGQDIRLNWFGGNAMDDQLRLQLLHQEEVLDEVELQFGVSAASYHLSEDIKVDEGYSLRLLGTDTNITWETQPFEITRVKEKKWYFYAIPAAIVTAITTYLLLNGPIDPPEEFPTDG